MRRSPELIPLSHHHHVALEHALRLRRATDDDVAAVVARYLAFLREEGEPHIAQEEHVLTPALPARERERLLADHTDLRRRARALAGAPDRQAANALGEALTAHVRFEERVLLPLLEQRLSPAELAEVGRRLAA